MAYKGKNTCRILKDIRRQIAEANDIDLVIKECTYQGDCLGTCPRCEAEVAYLERELAHRQALGKAVCISGIAASALLGVPAAVAAQTQCAAQTPAAQNSTAAEQDMMLPVVENAEIEEGGEEEVFVLVEKMPSFPGGEDALFRFLSDNVRYPSEIQGEAHIECRVIVQFTVYKDGSIVDVEVVRSPGYEAFEKEAVRVIRLMPKWNPGEQRGKAVNVRYTVPFNFKLAD